MGKTTMQTRCTEAFKQDVDAHAEALGLNTSEFIREALRQKMQREAVER